MFSFKNAKVALLFFLFKRNYYELAIIVLAVLLILKDDERKNLKNFGGDNYRYFTIII